MGSFLSLHVQKWILCDKMVSMASRLKFFDAMITPVVCFGAGHRKIYTNFLRDLARGRALASPPQIPRCIGAGNRFDVLWVRQLTSTGTSRGIQYFMHGRTGLINSWKTMVARYGRRNICPRIGNLQITFLYLMKKSLGEVHLALEPRRWKAWTVISPMANSNTACLPLASVGRVA